MGMYDCIAIVLFYPLEQVRGPEIVLQLILRQLAAKVLHGPSGGRRRRWDVMDLRRTNLI